jgi:hypothetical protein
MELVLWGKSIHALVARFRLATTPESPADQTAGQQAPNQDEN